MEKDVDKNLGQSIGRVSDLPDYPLCPRMKEKLIELGYDGETAEEMKSAFDLCGGYMVTWGWKEGRYMIAWDVNNRQWSLRNFPVCKN